MNRKAEAIESLQIILSKGQTVYTNLKHVSQSGMQRGISVHFVNESGKIRDISHLVGLAMDYKMHNKGGLKVNGAGMDMGFHVVYGLSSFILGDGYALKHEWI